MPSSDDQYRLNSRQRREIGQIGQKFHLNLAPPPSSLDEITAGPKFVSLTDFIEQFDWKYSDLDIIDRLEIVDFGTMTDAALEFARGTFAACSDEHNWYEHFQLLMRHPVINAGVQIAAWHRYRLPEDLLST